MVTEQEAFASAFNATTEELVAGKTGADVVTEPATPAEPAAPAAPEAVAPVAPVEPAAPASPVVAPVEPVAPAAVAPVAVVAPVEPASPAAPAVAAPVEPTAPAVPAAPAVDPLAAAEARARAAEAESARLTAELSTRAKVAPAEPVAPAAPVAPVVEAPKPFEFDAKQKEVIDEFEKEWPGIKAAYDVREVALIHGMETKFKQQLEASMTAFAKQIKSELDPVVSAHLQSDEERHFAKIRGAHADFDEVVKLVPAWIEKQPPFLKAAFGQIWEKGQADDIVDLVTRFNTESGRAQPQTPSPSSAAPVTTAPVVPVAPDQKKVVALTAVQTQKTSVNTEQPAPDDYETAFKKTVAELTAVAAK